MTTPAAYISYAWGDDDSPEGREREAIVDDLCRGFAQVGIVIGRDKNEVKPGDSIAAFGKHIARAPLILAVISHRSLRSEWCMLYELYEAYSCRGGDGKEFAEDVVALVLDDALPDLKNRNDLIAHWRAWCAGLEDELGQADPEKEESLESRKVLLKCKRMIKSLPDMLLAIRRIAMPRGSASIRRDDFRDINEYVQRKLSARSESGRLAPYSSSSVIDPRPTRSTVFISYCRTDLKWLERLKKNLEPFVQNGMQVWSDQNIPPGAYWAEEIRSALSQAKVAVLLVSPDFLASDFIRTNELPPLLDEAQRGGLKILPIPVHFSVYRQTEISHYKFAWNPDRPLASLSKAKANQALVEIAEAIAEAMNS